MSENNNQKYSYHEMSNKVEQVDRSLLRSRASEPTGEVESLRGREGIGRMGDRLAQSATASTSTSTSAGKVKSSEIQEQIQRQANKRQKRMKQQGEDVVSTKKEAFTVASGGRTILDFDNLQGYNPTTHQAREAYERLLTILGSRDLLGSQSSSVLRDAAEEVIRILKDENLRNPDRHNEISSLITGKPAVQAGRTSTGGLTFEHFSDLIKLGNQMDDYHDPSRQINAPSRSASDKIDDEMGVAVVFDDDDENNSYGDAEGASDIENGVVVDVSSASEDEESVSQDQDLGAVDDVGEEKMVQGDEAGKQKSMRQMQEKTLSVHDIDAHYLQRQLSRHFDDVDETARLAANVLDVLDIRKSMDVRECENKLLLLLHYDLYDTIKLLLYNRVRIWACVSLKRAQSDKDREVVRQALSDESTGEGQRVWEELHSKSRAEDWSRERLRGLGDTLKDSGSSNDVMSALDSINARTKSESDDAMDAEKENQGIIVTEIDLKSIAFPEGGHTMTNRQCDLPDTTWRATKRGYEEVHVPASRSVIPEGEKLVEISSLPDWTHPAFNGMDKLNRIQSKMCGVALNTSENLLLCAPTGAGKTNVACLTMLNILGQYRRNKNPDVDGEELVEAFDLNAFKIVYIAPMKALVQELVKNFTQRLSVYGVVVKELSGDSSLSRQQIAATQLLVTTPEKWDIVTRQGEGRAYTQLVKLVIIDEIHLLHDERGPVLESIVARVIRQVETSAEPIRLVGLSATLPNYRDVATFLRVKPDKGLFFFDHTYRPVPLQMQYIGLTERNSFKRFQLENEICYDKSIVQRQNGNQVLIFVHSRAETGKTAKALRDLAMERDELDSFVRDGGATQEILREESANATNTDLKDLLSYGFGIHHAGMNRADRELVEDLFADRHISVLCCTATLAWGVNLPAHAVIIRGTQIYNPVKGRWVELSTLDVLQMLGRAGRPQFDSEGEGIIITQHSKLQYYLSLTNLQLPVESQLIKVLADHLNAECVLGTVQSLTEAAEWLSYTFLYIRMLQHPQLYGIEDAETTLRDDPTLKRRRFDLAHSAATILEKNHLLRYDRKSGALQSTPLGRVASQFYISHTSMAVYTRHMRPNMSDIELLRLFAMSGEFAHITVREEEKLELAKLAGKVPIPIKESPNDPAAKVNILLQAYISRLKLDGFALVADMAFIQQSAARIMRCLFEIALKRNWASLAKTTLSMSNMVAYRVWRSQSPLRQFKNVPDVVCRKLERKSDIEWSRYPDLTSSDLGELVGVPKMGPVLYKLVNQFPRVDITANQIQPITRSLLRVELSVAPAFQFDFNVHGFAQLFHLFVEDVNCENILHHETFTIKSRDSEDDMTLVFTVPIFEPLPPAYFVRVISDRWLHSESMLPISFSSTILPARFPPPTSLLDLQPLLPSSIGEPALAKLFQFKEFNPIQTQTFFELFKTDHSTMVCAPSGSGKSVCAEFAIIRMLTSSKDGYCVYVTPVEENAENVYEDWKRRFGRIISNESVVRLTGEAQADLKLISAARIIVGTIQEWDNLSRRWRQRKAIQNVSLMIFDDLHFLGVGIGPTVEVVVSRMRYISKQQQDQFIRIVGLGASMANAREIGEWMGISSKNVFNFSPKARPIPLEIFFQSFDQSNYASRLMAMAKPVYNALRAYSDSKSTIVYVPSKRQAQLTAIDLMTYAQNREEDFLPESGLGEEYTATISTVRDQSLQQVLSAGVGFFYVGMAPSDWDTVLRLFFSGHIRVIVCPVDICRKVNCVAHLVVIMGTEAYDGQEKRHVDYRIVDMLHMMSRHKADSSGKCVIMCHQSKKETLKKLLNDPLPIESHLDSSLHDHMVSEIVAKTVESLQDAVDYITWTFLYRRLPRNPTYYGLQGTTNVHISEYLSEMVESILEDLSQSQCCKLTDEGEVSPLNLGMIAAYYYVQYKTIDIIASSVTPKTKIRGVLEILSASWEFTSLPLRYKEEKGIKILARTQPHPLPDIPYDAHIKTLVLLQCHFSRNSVSGELRSDQKKILKQSINLIQAIVDVISSNGWLKPALAAMELSQMVVQGLWNKDHPLKQIPHFTDEIVERCLAYKDGEPIETVLDILALDDDIRNDLLRLPDSKMADVAVFCNNYPSVEVSFEVQDADDIIAGEPVQILVQMEREIDEEMSDSELADLGKVSAPLYPFEKKEGWWVVIGDTSSNVLYSLKRTSFQAKQTVVLEFLAPDEAGDYNLTLFCMSDSYLGCDQEYSVSLNVGASDQTNDASSNESDEDE